MSIYDLIYCEDQDEYRELQEMIVGRYPLALLEDARDFVHEFRFSVEDQSIEHDEWYTSLLEMGIPLQSLMFQMSIHENTDHIKELIEAWQNAQPPPPQR